MGWWKKDNGRPLASTPTAYSQKLCNSRWRQLCQVGHALRLEAVEVGPPKSNATDKHRQRLAVVQDRRGFLTEPIFIPCPVGYWFCGLPLPVPGSSAWEYRFARSPHTLAVDLGTGCRPSGMASASIKKSVGDCMTCLGTTSSCRFRWLGRNSRHRRRLLIVGNNGRQGSVGEKQLFANAGDYSRRSWRCRAPRQELGRRHGLPWY